MLGVALGPALRPGRGGRRVRHAGAGRGGAAGAAGGVASGGVGAGPRRLAPPAGPARPGHGRGGARAGALGRAQPGPLPGTGHAVDPARADPRRGQLRRDLLGPGAGLVVLRLRHGVRRRRAGAPRLRHGRPLGHRRLAHRPGDHLCPRPHRPLARRRRSPPWPHRRPLRPRRPAALRPLRREPPDVGVPGRAGDVLPPGRRRHRRGGRAASARRALVPPRRRHRERARHRRPVLRLDPVPGAGRALDRAARGRGGARPRPAPARRGRRGPPAAVAPAAEPPLAAPEPAQTPDQTVVGQGSQRS